MVRSRASRRREPAADPQHLVDLVADGQRGVEVGRRVLEHRGRRRVPRTWFQVPRRARVSSTSSVAGCRARSSRASTSPGLGQQPEDGAAGERLAGAGLADQADGLAPADLERHVRGPRPGGRRRETCEVARP